MENSEPQGRWVQPVALHEHVLRTHPQPNARPARTRRYEPQAPYPAPLEPGLDRVSRSNRRSVAFPNRLELREVTYRLGLPTDFANARDRSHEVPEELGCASSGSFRCSGELHVPSTASTKVRSSRRMMRLATADSKFLRASASAFSFFR